MDRVPKASQRDWFVSLPAPIREQAIDLASEGVNAEAFPLEVALDALTELRGQRWVVYGGDFYHQAANGRWRPTYDAWYVEHQASEPMPAFIERSIDAAATAISKVQARLGEDAATERVVLTAAKPRPGDLARA